LNNYECPLCNLEFEGETCHSGCALGKGCAMVRCPRCNYEFVQDGSLSSFFRRFLSRRKTDAASANR
jgi:hypothetical protein